MAPSFDELIKFFIENYLPAIDISTIAEGSKGVSADQSKVIIALSRKCISISRGIAGLLAKLDLDNAQILMRSFIEGSAKFIYIMDPVRHSGLSNGDRLDEYSSTLYANQYITDSQDSERLRCTLFEIIKNQDVVDELFPRRDLDYLEKARQIDKSLRNKVAGRWRPLRIIEAAFICDPKLFAELAHQYMLSCHQAHVSRASLEMFSDDLSLEGVESIEVLEMRATHFIQLMILISDIRRLFFCSVCVDNYISKVSESEELEQLLYAYVRTMNRTREVEKLLSAYGVLPK